MLEEYRRKTNIGFGLGLIALLIGYLLSRYVIIGIVLWLAAILIYSGILIAIWGLWHYAKGKGYHGGWGFLGFLGIIGLIILCLLPDRNKEIVLNKKD